MHRSWNFPDPMRGENISPPIHEYCIPCPSIASALSQIWRFTLRHPENEEQKHDTSKTYMLKEDPFTGILGLREAKQALCYAVAGELPLLLYGPPGSGKSLLLNRTKALLPPLRESEYRKSGQFMENKALNPPLFLRLELE